MVELNNRKLLRATLFKSIIIFSFQKRYLQHLVIRFQIFFFPFEVAVTYNCIGYKAFSGYQWLVTSENVIQFCIHKSYLYY